MRRYRGDKMNEKRKLILISVFSTMVIAVLGIVFYYVYQGINRNNFV